jgi:DNA-binding CsgD family transcriptional regulator
MSDPRGMLMSEMSRRGTSPVLVGRATEMAALEAAFETVRQGGPAALLIGGEAGVGKTRLISEFTDAARSSGARVLVGGCLELGADGLPFGPFTAMLRDLVRETGAEEIAGMLPGSGGAIRELARLLPELASASALASTPASAEAGWSPTGSATAGEARARLFEEFLTLLERLAEQRPLLVVIEDAHWADRSSRDLIAFLIGYQRAMRNVLIVVTFRSDELHRTHPLRSLLAELARIDWVERTELPRLSRGQAEELATAVLGRTPGPPQTEALYKRAEGNPLFTEELLACPDGCEEIPGSLADLLLQTVRRLPEDTQELLRVASAGSGSTSHALLARVSGRTEDQLNSVIRPAVTGNVLVTTADGYTFRHALIREAVHEDLLPGEHSGVHTRYALAIEADPALVSDGRVDIERAHHWYSAHNTCAALVSAWQASAQASRAVAHAERLVLLARVLELWDQVPDAAERIGADHVRVLEEAATAASDAGEGQRGLAFVESALTELDESAAPVRVAMLLRQRHKFRKDLARSGDAANEMADLDRALALVPESVDKKARTQLLIAAAHAGCGVSGPQYRRLAQDALRLSREAGDLDAQAQALATLAMIEAGASALATPDSEPFRLLAQARATAQRAGAYQPLADMVITESHLLCGAGEYQDAADVARQGIADAERHGLARTSGAFLAINVAEPFLFLGRWDEALDVAERALDLAPPPLTRAGLSIVCASIAVARGDVATATRRLAASRAVLTGVRFDDQYHLPQAMLDIELKLATAGPAAAAAQASAELSRYDLSGASSPRYAWPLLTVAGYVAVMAVGYPGADDVAVLLGQLRSVAEKLDAFGPVQRAWQLTFAALVPLDDADPGQRLAAWDAAAAAWDALGQPYEAAATLLAAARAALAVGGAREPAALRLRRAAGLAASLRATRLARQITGLAQRAGISLTGAGSAGAAAVLDDRAGAGDGSGARPGARGGVRGGASGQLGLTGREFEVLRLVASGQSNRDIAAALFISPKTASVHVSNILAKLGAATRTEAAAKALALRLFDTPGAD